MDTVELDKLHWTQDLPPLRRQQTQEVRSASWPTRRGLGESGAAALVPRTQAQVLLFLELEKHLFLLTFLAL